jgi:hypothetical protein
MGTLLTNKGFYQKIGFLSIVGLSDIMKNIIGDSEKNII